jgi:outer membrane protein insertion porin family
LTPEQVAGLMEIKAGDVYSVDKIRKSVEALQNAYGSMGYTDARINKAELRDVTQPQVDLLMLITEGTRYRTGLIPIQGNDLTQQRVILKQIRLQPDRPLDTTALEETKKALEETRLFAPRSVKLTIQPEDEARPGYRDVLVEVEETNTGSLGFGVGISSDSGIIGSITLNQRNFDILDTPDSWGEFFSGRAFRGAGQHFNITLAPGTETQTYSISLSDPYLFDTDYSGRTSFAYTTREYSDYDEDRLSHFIAFGRRFGDRWNGELTFRASRINIRDIDSDAPVDVFEVEGDNDLTGVGTRFSRVTADSRPRPSTGTKLELGVEQVGALGGDFTFTRLTAEHVLYLPIKEDFLGRRTVLSLSTQVGWIPQDVNDSPTFERFYLGGRSFRGLDFRTVSPKGIQADTGTLGTDPVGGTWSFFTGVEVQQPLWEELISGVVFVDSGTVIDAVGFDNYRVSVGVGIRLYVGQISPVPLAFDFGFPILKEDGDDERLFSFSLDIPFR